MVPVSATDLMLCVEMWPLSHVMLPQRALPSKVESFASSLSSVEISRLLHRKVSLLLSESFIVLLRT